MTSLKHRPLTAAAAAALVLTVLCPIVSAQEQPTRPVREVKETSMSNLDKGNRQDELDKREKRSHNKNSSQQPAQTQYPNATRISPEAKASGKLLKELQSLQDLYNKKDMAAVMASADELGTSSTTSNYGKSFAYSLAASAAADQNNDAKAAGYFKKAIDSNGLDNDSHYNTMFNLAAIQYQQENYQDALATLDRFLTETKSEKPEHLSLRAGLLANLGRNDEAADAYKALISKSPNDKRLLMNAVATLQAADKFDQANILLEGAYKRGMLTDGKELRALYVGYMNASRWSDAKAVMEAGTSKGIINQDAQLAKDYMVLAQNAYAEDNLALAVEMYTKAGPIAADGEAYLNLAKVLNNSGKKADAKAAAQKALDKGLKKPEEANRILAR